MLGSEDQLELARMKMAAGRAEHVGHAVAASKGHEVSNLACTCSVTRALTCKAGLCIIAHVDANG